MPPPASSLDAVVQLDDQPATLELHLGDLNQVTDTSGGPVLVHRIEPLVFVVAARRTKSQSLLRAWDDELGRAVLGRHLANQVGPLLVRDPPFGGQAGAQR